MIYFVTSLPFLLVIIWLLNQLTGERKSQKDLVDQMIRQNHMMWQANQVKDDALRQSDEILQESGMYVNYDELNRRAQATVNNVEGE